MIKQRRWPASESFSPGLREQRRETIGLICRTFFALQQLSQALCFGLSLQYLLPQQVLLINAVRPSIGP
jgi:hypothetical protein